MVVDLVKLIRVNQWPKNFFVFLPLFFSGHFFKENQLFDVVIAFLVFCAVSSSVYIINDILDKNSDREHPEKCKRPIASGTINLPFALFLFISLIAGSFISSVLLFEIKVTLLLVAYLLLNLLYSFKLKHLAIVDITIISLGFIIRIMIGGAVINVYLSKWLVIMTFLLSVFLALAKRRDDLLILESSGKSMRKSLDGYNLQFVNYAMVFISSIVVVCYIMYTVFNETIKNENFYITSFFVLLGVLRYMQITYVENNSGSPSKILVTDPFTIINLIFWASSVFYFVYV